MIPGFEDMTSRQRKRRKHDEPRQSDLVHSIIVEDGNGQQEHAQQHRGGPVGSGLIQTDDGVAGQAHNDGHEPIGDVVVDCGALSTTATRCRSSASDHDSEDIGTGASNAASLASARQVEAAAAAAGDSRAHELAGCSDERIAQLDADGDCFFRALELATDGRVTVKEARDKVADGLTQAHFDALVAAYAVSPREYVVLSCMRLHLAFSCHAV
jgi:hypothetical protein